MRIIIDADGCPVVDITLKEAKRRGIECIIVCDTAHRIERAGARTITVDKGADSADFKIANLARGGDAVVTQDYGLAAMCLARGALPIRQDGTRYSGGNIGLMLEERSFSRRMRAAGVRMKGPRRRTAQDDARYAEALAQMLDETEKTGE